MWIEVLCYCARYSTKGVVPATIGEVVKGATSSFLERCADLRLLDVGGEAQYTIHDWDDYNGRDPKVMQAERQRRHRDKDVTNALPERDNRRDENVTRAQARARVPVPSPKDGTLDETLVVEGGARSESAPPSSNVPQSRIDPTQQKRAIAEAREVAKRWEGRSSEELDKKLDAIARAHRTVIPATTREELWDLAFGKWVA